MVEVDKKIVQYLDVEFDFTTGTVSPYMKPNAVLI